ncbi:MAG TPA: hypothetical protein GX706_00450, partial [Candidatus Moranbacteria bacterium]|nr:hypothetical protein [Candidatus Moranbacteria bacterium]
MFTKSNLFSLNGRNLLLFFLLFLFSNFFFPNLTQAELVQSGDLSINVPGYDAATGWSADAIYDATITANFQDSTSPQKSVSITLPEGMRFVAYPVNRSPVADTPEYDDQGSVLSSFVESIITPPKQSYYPSYNGTLTYNLTSNCEAIEIPIKLTVDENVYYGPKNFPNGIQAESKKNNVSLDTVQMEVNGVGSVDLRFHSSDWITRTMISSSNQTVNMPQGGVHFASFNFVGRYLKNIQAYYYYP